VGGVQYADTHFFRPLFSEVEEKLRTPVLATAPSSTP
jgi:hypothetical protein